MADDRNRDVYRAGTFIFAGLALLLAFAALAISGVAWSRSNDAKDSLRTLSAGGLLGHKVNVHLQEFTMTVAPDSVKAGDVTVRDQEHRHHHPRDGARAGARHRRAPEGDGGDRRPRRG